MLSSHSNILSLQKALLRQDLTVVDVVSHYLQQIEKTKELNQYIDVYAEEALKRAASQDQKIKEGLPLGKLFGMVLSHKDIIHYKDHPLSAASPILKGYVSKYNATVIERILDEDAILIGRVQCDEFAMGSSNENSVYGPVKNPHALDKIPGGSSGGCATSVASDTCWASLGTDTGGSVRQPAAFCNIIGFKPTYGRVSRHGLIAYASSFDQAGFLTRAVYDAALLTEITAGIDEFDASLCNSKAEKYTEAYPTASIKKIAYLDIQHFQHSMDAAIFENYQSTIEQWKSKGHDLHKINMDWLDYIIPAYYVMTTAEASSNLSRYDGIRYGHREEAETLDLVYKRSRSAGFGKEVKRRILLGTYVLSAGFYDAYYQKAQRVRQLIKNKLDDLFIEYDALVLPISPVMPWKIGEKMDDPVSVYLADIFTVLANVAGVPGISIPTGFDVQKLPIGTQLLAQRWNETKLLALADQLVK